MKCKVTTLDNKSTGDIELSEAVFGLSARADILHRMVNWQLAKRRSGNHKVKVVNEINGSTRKISNQKGGGRARHSKLIVIEAASLKEPKTKTLSAVLGKLGLSKVLFIDGPVVDANFHRAAANLIGVDVLPQQGANVYDILRCDTLVLTRAAVEHLEARLK